jgi:hypothetical protein
MTAKLKCVLLAASAALLALPAGAQAESTIGEIGALPIVAGCNGPKFELAPVQNSEYQVHTNGILTSWSTSASATPATGQALTMKVLRPFEGKYLVVGHNTQALVPGVVNAFKTAIPVRSGDLIGLDKTTAAGVDNACVLVGGVGDNVDVSGPEIDAADGATWTPTATLNNTRLNVKATVLEAPKVNALSATHGPVTGGTPVTITGTDLNHVQGVTFADVPATAVKEETPGQITVIAPPLNALTSATVIVKTIAGQVTSLTSFTYEGCQVPSVLHKRLSAAKQALAAQGCALGKVKKLHHRRGRKPPKVIKQSPRPGGPLLAPGAPVNLTVAR